LQSTIALTLLPFQLGNPPQFFPWFGYSGLVQPRVVQLKGEGLPSARLGSAAVVRNKAIAAKASMSRFTVRFSFAKEFAP